jgi:hypothetical protein
MSTKYKSPHCATSSILLLLNPTEAQIISLKPCNGRMPPTPVPSPLFFLPGCVFSLRSSGFPPPLLRPFLGRIRPSSSSFASLLFPRTQFSLDSKLWGEDFISAWNVPVVLTVALHFLSAVLCFILEWYGPKGCERIVSFCYLLLLCVSPMVSFYIIIIMYIGV